MEEEFPYSLLVATKRPIAECCNSVSDYIRRVLAGQEGTHTFHKFLPRLLSVLFGIDYRPYVFVFVCLVLKAGSHARNRGWIDSPATTTAADALKRLLSPTGNLFTLLLQLQSELGCLYEIPYAQFPVCSATFSRGATRAYLCCVRNLFRII